MSVVGGTAVASLINTRTQALGISRAELVELCGFKNIAKGFRRLDEVCAGSFSSADFLLCRLPEALSLEPHVVEAAVVATEQEKLREEKQRHRDTFRPYAIIICERKVPEPIWVAGVIGIDRILRIDFADGSVPVSYVQQALKEVKDKQRQWGLALPGFGRIKNFVINYSLDRAVAFNLSGEPVEILAQALQVGCTVTVGRNVLLPDKLRSFFV